MIGTESIIGTLILIGLLLLNELIHKKEKNDIFFPTLFVLSAIFLSVVLLAIIKIIR